MATEIASDPKPSTVTGGGVPGRERGFGVASNGDFEGEKGTILRNTSRKRMVNVELELELEKTEEKKKKAHFVCGFVDGMGNVGFFRLFFKFAELV